MSLDMTPKRLNALADQLGMTARNHEIAAKSFAADGDAELSIAAGGRANAARDTRTLEAALRAAAWLATPGNYVVELVVNDETRALLGYQAMTGGDSANPVGSGPTALAAVLDAVGVKP